MNSNRLSLSTQQPLENIRGSVLCVDDEPNILRALSWLLRKDFEVITSESAKEALNLVRSRDFDVVISDQRMPEMNGSDFLKEVKTIAPRAMRILLTGYSDMQAVLQSVNESEVFRFISKPWDVVELPRIIAEAAEIARRPSAPATRLPTTADLDAMSPAERPKILVLDEDDATHSAIEMSIGDLAEIMHITSPVDAFKMLEDEKIGIIVSERKLGSMDLTHLLCLLKRKRPHIVSMIVTESEDSHLIAKMINQGQIFRFISKPLKISNLRQVLKSAIEKRDALVNNPQLAERHKVITPEDDNPTLEKHLISEVDREKHKTDQDLSSSLMHKLGRLAGRLFSR